MGEIGLSRHDFYYELKWWEVKSIIRGYNGRHHHGWEQARLVAYNAHFCMGSKHTPPTVSEWLKFPWEKVETTPISEDECKELQAEMNAINAAIEAKAEGKE